MKTLGRITAAIAFSAALLPVPLAYAESNLDFSIENQTGHTINELYLSPTRKDNWGRQVLSSPLKNGDTRKLSFKSTARTQSYDLKAVYNDGGSPVWYSLEPATFSKVTLKWNKQTRKTTLQKHR